MNPKILTLVIIHQHDKVLLGMKKRGLGMGNWNGFGGKVQEGESVEDAAKREVTEESQVTATDLQKMGVIDFSWIAKPEEILQVHVFKTTEFTGEPNETEEMKPQWFDVKEIPYKTMWPDDVYWLPLFLEDKKFQGKFVFNEKNEIIEHQLNQAS